MQIPYVKISGIFLLGISTLLGQGETSAPVAASNSPSSSESASNASKPSDNSAALDYLMNRKPQDGSVGKQAFDASKRGEDKAIAEDAVGAPGQVDPATRARFEKYLGTAPIPPEILDEYFITMKDTSALLRDNKVFEAWKKLYALADFQMIDAGVSRELANRVESIWNSDRANTKLDQRNDALKKEIKGANWNADLLSEKIRDEETARKRQQQTAQQPRQNRPNPANSDYNNPNQPPQNTPSMAAAQPNNESTPDVGNIQGKLQLTEEYLRSLELKATIKVNKLKQEQLFEQAKKNFADYVATLFNSGRFNHVVLAADFYRRIFNEDEYPVDMANEVNAALEINRDVQSSVEVFQYKVDRGQLSGATENLQLAFLTSELHPAVLGLARSPKEKIADFNDKLKNMKNLIEARDFTNLEVLLNQIKSQATDFDITKPLAIVNAAKLESKLHLGKAKLAAQQGDQKQALEEFQSAAQAWPSNPALEENAGVFFQTQDLKNQSITEFDRLVEAQDYRAIFEKQLAFAPAIKGDSKREEALKKALESIRDAEIASEKANTLILNGDPFGAWEAIELAAVNLPDDKKLNKLRADLSGRSAEFVSTINKAREAELRNEVGYSLTWFVNAQRKYPASQIANQGIERLSKKILEPQS